MGRDAEDLELDDLEDELVKDDDDPTPLSILKDLRGLGSDLRTLLKARAAKQNEELDENDPKRRKRLDVIKDAHIHPAPLLTEKEFLALEKAVQELDPVFKAMHGNGEYPYPKKPPMGKQEEEEDPKKKPPMGKQKEEDEEEEERKKPIMARLTKSDRETIDAANHLIKNTIPKMMKTMKELAEDKAKEVVTNE